MTILVALLALALQDPTRPPAAMLQPRAGSLGSAGAAMQQDAHRLQSILIGRAPGGRRVAVIDGDTVRVGDRVGGARVLAIEAGAVQIEQGGKRSTLTLTAPPVTPATAPAKGPATAPAPAPAAPSPVTGTPERNLP